jgi:L-arabinonolactonase
MGQPLGALYRLDSDLTWHKLDEGFGVVNGPCWSPDGRHFYVSDSRQSTIFVYDYDTDSGTITNKRVFATTTELGGLPDGATVDAEGYLWSAICIGGRIARFAPDGRLTA